MTTFAQEPKVEEKHPTPDVKPTAEAEPPTTSPRVGARTMPGSGLAYKSGESTADGLQAGESAADDSKGKGKQPRRPASPKPAASSSKAKVEQADPDPTPGKITTKERGGRPAVRALTPDQSYAQLILVAKFDVIKANEAAAKAALGDMAGPGCVFKDTSAVGDEVVRRLKVSGAIKEEAVDPSVVIVPKVEKPKRALGDIAAELARAIDTPDLEESLETSLTKDDLSRLEQTNAHTRRLAQVATHMLKLLKPPKKKKGTEGSTTADAPTATSSVAASQPADSGPAESPGYVAPKVTVKLLRQALKNRDADKDLDRSPAIPALTTEERGKATVDLRKTIPTIANDEPMFAAVEKLFHEAVDTQMMATLREEMVIALRRLDRHWDALKPKARTSLQTMVAKTNEYGGMRGVIGEISAAAFAAEEGRKDISVGNEKLFLPDTFAGLKPIPGVDSQDVDTTSNLGDERFYTEAKYDMKTFLDKAKPLSEKKAQKKAAAQAKLKEGQAKKSGAPTGDTSAVDESTASTLPAESDDDSDTEVAEAVEPKGSAAATSSVATTAERPFKPEQLEHYKAAATRTKTKKPRKKAWNMHLEVYIANRTGWPQVFFRNKLLKYMAENQWHVRVDGVDLLKDPEPFTKKVLEVRTQFKATHTDADAEAFDAWLDKLSVKFGPRDFLGLEAKDMVAAIPYP